LRLAFLPRIMVNSSRLNSTPSKSSEDPDQSKGDCRPHYFELHREHTSMNPKTKIGFTIGAIAGQSFNRLRWRS
jgi:hypothetical protein